MIGPHYCSQHHPHRDYTRSLECDRGRLMRLIKSYQYVAEQEQEAALELGRARWEIRDLQELRSIRDTMRQYQLVCRCSNGAGQRCHTCNAFHNLLCLLNERPL